MPSGVLTTAPSIGLLLYPMYTGLDRVANRASGRRANAQSLARPSTTPRPTSDKERRRATQAPRRIGVPIRGASLYALATGSTPFYLSARSSCRCSTAVTLNSWLVGGCSARII